MKVKLEPGAFEPTRAHELDAGMDIKAYRGGLVRAGQSRSFRTGVHVQLPENTVGLILPKSGLMVHNNILCFGVVDEGYTGEVIAHVFNHGATDYEFSAGQKIAQMVVVPVVRETVEIVDEIDGGERGERGFGSSGK